MKIKTVWTEYRNTFDATVNSLLTEGWLLSKREVLPAPKLEDSVFYAEMVLLDAADKLPAEPSLMDTRKAMDAFNALRVIRDTCEAAGDCTPDECPICDACRQLRRDTPPEFLTLPGEVLE